MSVRDYVMPHRLAANKSLRRAADNLRAHIDEHQASFNQKRSEYAAEIDAAERRYAEKLKSAESAMAIELAANVESYEAVCRGIAKYVDLYLHRICLKEQLHFNEAQDRVLREEASFLYQNMTAIRKEIRDLRARQDLLSMRADVGDIVALSEMSGNDLGFEAGDDAFILLRKVRMAFEDSECDELTKRVLGKLKIIIKERAQFLDLIVFIEWAIGQEKHYLDHLSSRRDEAESQIADVEGRIESIESEIKALHRMIEKVADAVRLYWSKPIAFLNADICYAEEAKREGEAKLVKAKKELDDHFANRESAFESHELERWKRERDRLKREKGRLKSKVKTLDDSINAYKAERSRWLEKKDFVFDLCARNGAPLVSDTRYDVSDEELVLRARLSEIREGRRRRIAEAVERCNLECDRINEAWEASLKARAAEKRALQKEVQALYAEQARLEHEVRDASALLERSKKADGRFFLVKFISPSSETFNARESVKAARSSLRATQNKISDAESRLMEIRRIADAESEEYKRKLDACKPIPESGEPGEELEEKKLAMRLDQVLEEKAGGRYGC